MWKGRMMRMRDRLGASGPGLTVAVVAVVLALGGAAFAAGGGLTGKQKKQVEKIAKKFAGKPGATGPAGAPGPKGDAGAKGASGNNGTNGTNGTSVVATPEPPETGNCEGLGGSKFVSGAVTTFACNGGEGSPWTEGGTLPPEATETGTWTVSGTEAADTNGLYASISFPVQLEKALDASHVVFGNAFPKPPECSGGSTVKPKASPGYLCIFESGNTAGTEFLRAEDPNSILSEEEAGAGVAGARLRFAAPTEEVAFASGTFAVTAPATP